MNSWYQIQSHRLPQLGAIEFAFISGQLMAKICIAFKIYNLPSSCIQHSGSTVYNQIRLTVVSQTAADCTLSTEGKKSFHTEAFSTS